MTVFEFLNFCPIDHNITIEIDTIERVFFMKNRCDFKALGDEIQIVMYARIDFVHAEDLKAFHITARL